ncbi:MAG: M42 family peptidase [Oscillospiraceae bacterium]|jgi:endoglucanase
MLERLKTLCDLNGISGNENEVREYIISEISGKCEYSVDNSGNILCFKKGKKTPLKKLMVSAHMDEVGMIVTFVNSDGTLKISNVGGVDPKVIFGRAVTVGERKIHGVIGSKAVHNLTAEEKDTAVKAEKLYIDIGARDKEDAEKYISLGDSVSFMAGYTELGDGFIKSKAIDDRAGCAIILEMLASELEYDTHFAFVTQEEIGLRGAKTAAYTINPDIALVLEATTAADIPDVSDDKRVCRLGGGAVVSFMDKATIYDKELYQLAFKISKERHIACQTKTMVAGGNDSGAIHISRSGVRTIAVSVPCRYLHSPSCVIKREDLESVKALAFELISRVHTI